MRRHADHRTGIAAECIAEGADRARILALAEAQRSRFAEVGPRVFEHADEEVVALRAAMVSQHTRGNVADAAVIVANHRAKRAQHCRVHVVRALMHVDMDLTGAAARHRHWVGIGCGIGMPGSAKPCPPLQNPP